MICPNCRSEIREGKKFCGICGTALAVTGARPSSAPAEPGSLNCPSCRSEVPQGKKFCGACGSPVGERKASALSSDIVVPPISLPLSPQSRVSSQPIASTPANRLAGSPAQWSARRPTIGKGYSRPKRNFPSRKVLGFVAASIVLLLCAGVWYAWGVEIVIVSDPANAAVVLDGKLIGSTNGQGGSLVVPHVTHGTHSLALAHFGFDQWSHPISLGWLELSHSLNVKLPLPSFPLTVLTNPGGARVQVDGKEVGISDGSGALTVQDVPRGEHVVTVMLADYPSWSSSLLIQAPFTIRVDLAAIAAAAQQQIASRLASAQMLFQQRQYQAAIAECEAVLRFDPSNQQAASLRAQIQQTMSILGVQ